jgi:hypothetical protein
VSFGASDIGHDRRRVTQLPQRRLIQRGNHGISTDYLADCPGQVIERCRFRRGCRGRWEVRQIVLPFYTRNERISAPRNVLDEASGDMAFTEQLSERGKVNA